MTLANINTTPSPALGGGSVSQVFFGGRSSFSTNGNATIYLPATFALGASYTMGKLTVNADADWTFWHSFTSLPISFRGRRPASSGFERPEELERMSARSVSGRNTG